MWVFCSRTCPKQPLGTGAGVVDAVPAGRAKQIASGFVRAFGDSDADLVAQRVRYFARDCRVPATDKNRGHGADSGLEPLVDSSIDGTQERLCCGDVLLV